MSKKTTAVVVGSEPGAAKLSKANELGIPVLDEAGFAHLLETGEVVIERPSGAVRLTRSPALPADHGGIRVGANAPGTLNLVATPRIADAVGRVLGDRYRLTRPLGVGASAHVFVAEDVNLRRRVAIKVLHPGLAADEAFGRRFQAEARVAAALRHPNILRVYDWGYDDGAPYLVMELLEGGSLRALLDRNHLLSPAQAAAIGADVARALDYAHRRGLVHRDIKPANLIFDDEGRITVADFGLARALAEATWTEPTGAVVGTARYAAPEAVRGESLDSRADVYALALVLIEATTGSVPFAADTTLATLLGPPRAAHQGTGGDRAARPRSGGRRDAPTRPTAWTPSAWPGPSTAWPPSSRRRLRCRWPATGREAELDRNPTDYPGRPRLFDGAQDRCGRRGRFARRPAGPAAVGPARGAAGGRRDRSAGRRSGGPGPGRTPIRPGSPDGSADGLRPPGRSETVALVGWPCWWRSPSGAPWSAASDGSPDPVPPGSRPGRLEPGRRGPAAARRCTSTWPCPTGPTTPTPPPAPSSASAPPAAGCKEGSTVAVTLSLGPRPVSIPDVVGLQLGRGHRAPQLSRASRRRSSATSASMTVPAGRGGEQQPRPTGTLLPGQPVSLVVSSGKADGGHSRRCKGRTPARSPPPSAPSTAAISLPPKPLPTTTPSRPARW